ncbi:MAG: hypothetical protein JNK09_06845 [Prolixibacteraceae bacterium]|nr:hypothetical protein [Prolixibacteraceae bacterium]
MNNLNIETINLLDKIIDRLDLSSELDNKAILAICNNDPKLAEKICKILEFDGWIKAVWLDGLKYPGKIEKSNSFSVNLMNGNYATRDELKKDTSKHLRVANNITAKNSNIIIGDNVNQTIKIKNNLAEKKSLFGIVLLIIGAVAGIFTILTYFK